MRSLPLAIILTISTTAQAVELGASARVSIVNTLNVAEISPIDFGTISNVNGVCTMTSSGELIATAGHNCAGNSTPGIFRISGTNDQTVVVSVRSTEVVDGITFNPMIAGSSNKTLTGGTIDITITGSLSLSNVTDGYKVIPYTLTTNYQ
jgi:hypothetical protein